MADSHTITYPLYVTAGGVNDDLCDLGLVEFEGDIVPYRRASGPNWDSAGEPAEGGYAELTGAALTTELKTRPPINMDWLLWKLDKATLDHISTLIYEDWQQDDRRTA